MATILISILQKLLQFLISLLQGLLRILMKILQKVERNRAKDQIQHRNADETEYINQYALSRKPIEKALIGGYSDPRNSTILKMFNMIDVCERSGSGIPKILSVWEDERWDTPRFEEEYSPDRTILTLPINNVSASNLVENLVEKVTTKDPAGLC